MLSPEALQLIDREVAKYPADQARSAVMGALRIALTERREQGRTPEERCLTTELVEFVADYLGIPPVAAYEVATFYNMYDMKPVGKYKLNVCTNLPCQLRDGYKALHHLEHKLGIKMGETTADGMFTLQQSECLGACADSPVMLVNDRCMCSFMSNEKLDELVDGLRAAEGKA